MTSRGMATPFNDRSRIDVLERELAVLRTELAALRPERTNRARTVPAKLYVGLTDGSGITARSGTTPGSGNVALHWQRGSTLEDLGETVACFNYDDSAVAASTYIAVKQDVYGVWWAMVGEVTEVKWAVAQSDWTDPGGSACPKVSVKDCDDCTGANPVGTAFDVLLPESGCGTPDVVTGDVIGYMLAEDATKVCVTDYMRRDKLWGFQLKENMGATTPSEALADLLEPSGIDTGVDVQAKDNSFGQFEELLSGQRGLMIETCGEYRIITPRSVNHVAKTPSGGIAARSGDSISAASCTIYEIAAGQLNVKAAALDVWNISDEAIPGNTYIPVHQDVFDDWWTEGVGGGTTAELIRYTIASVDNTGATWSAVVDITARTCDLTSVTGESGGQVTVQDPCKCWLDEPAADLVGRCGGARYMKPTGASCQWEIDWLCCPTC